MGAHRLLLVLEHSEYIFDDDVIFYLDQLGDLLCYPVSQYRYVDLAQVHLSVSRPAATEEPSPEWL